MQGEQVKLCTDSNLSSELKWSREVAPRAACSPCEVVQTSHNFTKQICIRKQHNHYKNHVCMRPLDLGNLQKKSAAGVEVQKNELL